MEEEKNKVYTVVALVALAALLLSCMAGAMAGGMAGAIVGRRQAQAAIERAPEMGLGEILRFRARDVRPWREDWPLPAPDREGEFPPLEVPPRGTGGALVLEIVPGSPAVEAGLQVGELITGIDSTPIDSNHPLADVVAQYEPGDRITLHLWRAGQEDSVRVKLTEHPDYAGRAYLGIFFEMLGDPETRGP